MGVCVSNYRPVPFTLVLFKRLEHICRWMFIKDLCCLYFSGKCSRKSEEYSILWCYSCRSLRYKRYISNISIDANTDILYIRKTVLYRLKSIRWPDSKRWRKGNAKRWMRLSFENPQIRLSWTRKKVRNDAERFITGNVKYETWILTRFLEKVRYESFKKRRKQTKSF